MEMNDTLTRNLNTLNSLLKSNEGESDARELFCSVYLVHDYDADGNRKVGTIECGSFRVQDTPKALYRLLFLTKARRVDFSEMYKSNSLFALTSPDGQFVADLQFFKHELAAYLSAPANHIEGKQHCIIAGAPGADNGIHIKSADFNLWAQTLKKCLDKTWMVYGGNDFEV